MPLTFEQCQKIAEHLTRETGTVWQAAFYYLKNDDDSTYTAYYVQGTKQITKEEQEEIGRILKDFSEELEYQIGFSETGTMQLYGLSYKPKVREDKNKNNNHLLQEDLEEPKPKRKPIKITIDSQELTFVPPKELERELEDTLPPQIKHARLTLHSILYNAFTQAYNQQNAGQEAKNKKVASIKLDKHISKIFMLYNKALAGKIRWDDALRKAEHHLLKQMSADPKITKPQVLDPEQVKNQEDSSKTNASPSPAKEETGSSANPKTQSKKHPIVNTYAHIQKHYHAKLRELPPINQTAEVLFHNQIKVPAAQAIDAVIAHKDIKRTIKSGKVVNRILDSNHNNAKTQLKEFLSFADAIFKSINERIKNDLKKREYLHHLLADFMSYHLFAIARLVPLGQRNGSGLYQEVMLMINKLQHTRFDLSQNRTPKEFDRIRSRIEDQIRGDNENFAQRASLFENEAKELLTEGTYKYQLKLHPYSGSYQKNTPQDFSIRHRPRH